MQGIDPYENASGTIQLDPSHLAIEAAVMGIGIILESDILVARELSAGRLVSPFPHLNRSGLSYWIFIPSPRRPGSAVDAVIGWLRAQAAVEPVGEIAS